MTKFLTADEVRAALSRSLEAGPGAFDPRLCEIFKAAADKTAVMLFAQQAITRGGPKAQGLQSDPVALTVYIISLAVSQGIQIGLDAAGASLPMD